MSVERQLDELLAAGRQMLAVAEAGEWGRANEIQTECQRRAEALFAEPLGTAEATAAAKGVEELIALHAQVIELCSSARDNSMQDMDEFNQGRQAVAQYTANSG